MFPLFKVVGLEKKFFTSLSEVENYSYGEKCVLFETKLKNFFNVKEVLTTNSYSSAWVTLLDSLQLSSEDEIIASPMACLASTQPLIRTAARLRWCDIDKDTGLMSADYLEEVINENTKLVVVNLFCGFVPDLKRIFEISKMHNAIVILDLIEGLGSKIDSEYVGSQYCDAALVSTEPVRVLNSNQGGAIFLNNPNLIQKAVLARDYGIDRSIFRKTNGEINEKLDISLRALGQKQNEISALFGLASLASFEVSCAELVKRARLWDQFVSKTNLNVQKLKIVPGTEPNYWVYGVLVDDTEIAMEWFISKGFQSSSVHIRNDIYSVFKEARTDLPGVDSFSKRFLALPTGSWVESLAIQALSLID